jgi:hypothetical protein
MPAIESTFRQQTGKRKFSRAFVEEGAWWILDAQGHQWCLVDGGWECFTDDDDPFVVELKQNKGAVARARAKARATN